MSQERASHEVSMPSFTAIRSEGSQSHLTSQASGSSLLFADHAGPSDAVGRATGADSQLFAGLIVAAAGFNFMTDTNYPPGSALGLIQPEQTGPDSDLMTGATQSGNGIRMVGACLLWLLLVNYLTSLFVRWGLGHR